MRVRCSFLVCLHYSPKEEEEWTHVLHKQSMSLFLYLYQRTGWYILLGGTVAHFIRPSIRRHAYLSFHAPPTWMNGWPTGCWNTYICKGRGSWRWHIVQFHFRVPFNVYAWPHSTTVQVNASTRRTLLYYGMCGQFRFQYTCFVQLTFPLEIYQVPGWLYLLEKRQLSFIAFR